MTCTDCGPDEGLCLVHLSNPHAGQITCPGCGSARWTMPFGLPAPDIWRCVSCHLSFLALAEP